MLFRKKTGKKTILVVAALMLIVAGSLIWSRSGSIEQQAAAKKAKAAEASLTISPSDMMSQGGKDLPTQSWGDPF